VVSLEERRRCVAHLLEQYEVGERRACQVAGIHRSSYRYHGHQEQKDLRYQRVIALSKRYPYWGYRKMHNLMQSENHSISRERVRLIRRQEGLKVPKNIANDAPLVTPLIGSIALSFPVTYGATILYLTKPWTHDC